MQSCIVFREVKGKNKEETNGVPDNLSIVAATISYCFFYFFTISVILEDNEIH